MMGPVHKQGWAPTVIVLNFHGGHMFFTSKHCGRKQIPVTFKNAIDVAIDIIIFIKF